MIWRWYTAFSWPVTAGGELAVQVQHGLNQQSDHPLVARDVGGVGEVHGAEEEWTERYGRLPETLDWIGVKRRVTGNNWIAPRSPVQSVDGRMGLDDRTAALRLRQRVVT